MAGVSLADFSDSGILLWLLVVASHSNCCCENQGRHDDAKEGSPWNFPELWAGCPLALQLL